jgi:hypothetical protein
VPVNCGSSKEWNLISIKLPDSINGFNNEVTVKVLPEKLVLK